MLYKEWEFFYDKIKQDLQLNFEKDIYAASLLDSILDENNLTSIKKIESLIKNRCVFVFGSGPSLEETIHTYKEKIDDSIKITADGATSLLLENNIKPDIIVTDLDGCISDQVDANGEGSIAVIHAHGDNTDVLQKYVKNFQGEIIGTTQTNPSSFKNLYNFGGFTDGDRAVFLADHFKAKKIFLVGFDFTGKIGKYSFSENKNTDMKLRKLKWCETLIKTIIKQNKNIEFL